MKHIENILNNQFDPKYKALCEDKIISEEINIEKDMVRQVLDKLQELEEERGNLLIKLNNIAKSKKIIDKFSDICFVRICNSEIQWIYNYNFSHFT